MKNITSNNWTTCDKSTSINGTDTGNYLNRKQHLTAKRNQY